MTVLPTDGFGQRSVTLSTTCAAIVYSFNDSISLLVRKQNCFIFYIRGRKG